MPSKDGHESLKYIHSEDSDGDIDIFFQCFLRCKNLDPKWLELHEMDRHQLNLADRNPTMS